MASAQCSADFGTMLGATQANATKAGAGSLGTDLLTTNVSGTLDGAGIYSSIAVLAAVCNQNPVIVLKYPSNCLFKGINVSG